MMFIARRRSSELAWVGYIFSSLICKALAFTSQVPDNPLSASVLSRWQKSNTRLFSDQHTYSYLGFGSNQGEVNDINKSIDLPPQSEHGIYQLKTERQYQLLLQSHPEKLIVVKFFAPYCKACKSLAPKFIAVKKDPQMKGLPVIWAEYEASKNSKDLFRQIGVLTLPTVHFYDGSRGLIENFPCGPARVPLLKKKLARFINDRVDPESLVLKPPPVVDPSVSLDQPIAPRVRRDIVVDNELITPDHIFYLKDDLPFFRDCTDSEFKTMLGKAKLLTFDAGDLIIRQGKPGRTFYVIKSGVAEMSVRSRFELPLLGTPSNYLGVVVNELRKWDYFGERALTTGEPLKASVRVLEKVRCFAFDVDDIPESSILNRKRRATRDTVDKLNRRYELPADYTPEYVVNDGDDNMLELLIRFRQIRQAAKCFEYVMNTDPNWGDTGEIARRIMLVSKLSLPQREEFQKVFDIVDNQGRGKISLLEMKKFMDSAMQKKTEAELQTMIARVNTSSGDFEISRDEFMGVMAEAEFYNLFTETFQELDKENTGYVRAGDLDEVLGGVRGLVSDNPTNLVDSEDKDMLVDYEQFSKMLLGAAL